MRAWLILILLPLLAMSGAAEKKVVNAEPYLVSFDMGSIGQYNVKVNQSLLDEGELNLVIASGNNLAAIIYAFPDKNGEFATNDAQKSFMDEIFNKFNVQPDYYKRTIDGQGGLLGVANGNKAQLFGAIYSKEITGYGYILVSILTAVPWNQGSEALLDSLKIDYTPTSTISPFGTPYGTPGTGANYGTPYSTSNEYETMGSNTAAEIISPYFKGKST